MSSTLPYILEPIELVDSLDQKDVLVVDLCKREQYAQAHIPGATYLDYARIVAAKPPAMGLLPDKQQLQMVFSAIGITPTTHVVAYDDEGGGKAARLLWTLAAVGHKSMSLLNGGIHAWSQERFPMDSTPSPTHAVTDTYQFDFQKSVIADRSYILDHLGNSAIAIMDARSEAEYTGAKKFAERAGHIPGAINLDWMLLMDQARNLRLKNATELNAMLQSLQIDPSQEVIVYCQTHHRSALNFVALTSLGYQKVRGYPGSWSDWGNSNSTPID